MRANFRQDFRQENRLRQREFELSELRARHAAAEVVWRQLLDQIDEFKRYCHQTVAWRLAELEHLEAESAHLGGYYSRPQQRDEKSNRGDSLRDRDFPVYDIKTTYRKVAKAIHPDMAGDIPSALNRHELMSKANRAYAEADLRTLRRILGDCRHEGLARDDDEDAELERVEGQIASERQELQEVEARVEALRQSCAWRLKLRHDTAPVRDALLDELVAIADESIAKAVQRLAVLKGEKPRATRTLHFPDEVTCGVLYLRERASVNYSDWKAVSRARGAVAVDADKAVRLDVRGVAAKVAVGTLKGDALHSLFLYDANDEDIGNILHLTEVEELYLSGERITDTTLILIASLANLRRLYLYQTSISDAGLLNLRNLQSLTALTCSGNSITEDGLARFRRAVPNVRTVSFQWRR